MMCVPVRVDCKSCMRGVDMSMEKRGLASLSTLMLPFYGGVDVSLAPGT